MAVRAATSDNLTTYEIGVPFLLWRPKIRRSSIDERLDSLANHSERLLGIPVLGRLGWLGLLIPVLGGALMTALFGLLLCLEWVASAVLSAALFAFKLVGRKEFSVRASLVGYVGARRPRDGQVLVGPRERPTTRPVRIEWSRRTLSTALSARQEMADHIRAVQFADPGA